MHDGTMSDESVTSESVPQEHDIVRKDSGSLPAHRPVTSPASPASQAMASAKSEAMPPPSNKPPWGHSSRKRSNDEIDADEGLAHGLRNPTNNNGAQAVKQDKPHDQATNIDSSPTVIPDSQKQGLSQQAPTSSTANQPQQTPASAQPPKSQSNAKVKKSTNPAETEIMGATAEGERFEDGYDSSECSDFGGPDERIAEFDWRELEVRYHEIIQIFDEKEAALFEEWNGLIDSFGIWAAAGSQKEVDRSFKRLKTQMVYVRNEENELEQKRLHYVKVVEAFQTVGFILNDPNWAEDRIVPKSKRRTPDRPTSHHNVRPLKRRRLHRQDDYGVRRADDADAERHRHYEPHASRCVVS